jgi:hypothetical protein
VKGCVTKTLNGIDCYQLHALSMESANRAVQRLGRFRFVGILEDWNETLVDFMWFNSMSGSSIQLDEMLTSVHRSTGDHELASALKRQVDYDDPYDTLVYEAAQGLAAAQRKLRLDGQGRGRDKASCQEPNSQGDVRERPKPLKKTPSHETSAKGEWWKLHPQKQKLMAIT